VIVDCAVYEKGRRQGGRVSVEEALGSCRASPSAFVWIGLFEPTAEEFDQVAGEFQLHPLAREDALHAHQRPKLEHFHESWLAVLKTARYADPTEKVQVGEVLVLLGDSFVVTVRHGEATELSDVRRELERDPQRLACGPFAVLHAVADRVVDDYGHVLELLEGDVDEVQDEVFLRARPGLAERIFNLKRELADLGKALTPLIEPLHQLANADIPARGEELKPYFRDVQDHAMRMADRADAVDRLLSDALHANVAEVGVRQNEDMRKISAWAAIGVLPTMIAGIYGMNFDHMPELRWRYGYLLVILFMAACCFALYRNFKHRGWL
jgi:magnesium transporter